MHKYNHIELLLQKDIDRYILGDNSYSFHDHNITTSFVRNFYTVICNEWVRNHIGNEPKYIKLIIQTQKFPKALHYKNMDLSQIFYDYKTKEEVMSHALFWKMIDKMDSNHIWVKAEPITEETYQSSVWGDRIENL